MPTKTAKTIDTTSSYDDSSFIDVTDFGDKKPLPRPREIDFSGKKTQKHQTLIMMKI